MVTGRHRGLGLATLPGCEIYVNIGFRWWRRDAPCAFARSFGAQVTTGYWLGSLRLRGMGVARRGDFRW